MFEKKIEKANEQIKKVVDYLKEHKDAFKSMNLKLYDAFYYFMSDEMEKEFPLTYADNEGRNESDDFYWFCDDSYRLFKEDLEENFEIDFSEIQHSIGTTSSFYLHDNTIELDRYDDIDTDVTIENFICEYYNDNYCNIENVSIKIDEYYIDNEDIDYSEEIENELDYIINDLYNDVINYCKDIITVYDIIKNFKDNQVEYFKEYLECEEERLQEEKEEEERVEKENKDNCVGIKEKYNISDEDMEILKKCIADYE